MRDAEDDSDETTFGRRPAGIFRSRRSRTGPLAVSERGIIDPAGSGFRVAAGSFLERLGLGVPLRLAVVGGLLAAALVNMPWRAPDRVAGHDAAAPARQAARPVPLEDALFDAPLSAPEEEEVAAVASPRPKPDPQSLCDVMAGGAAVAPWAESQLFPGQWECFVDFSEGGDAGKAGPIFSIIRGRDAGTADVIRLKLSIAEDDAEPRWHRLMADMAAALAHAAGGTLPASIAASLETLEPARAVENGLDIEFAPEKAFPGRYNLIIKLHPS